MTTAAQVDWDDIRFFLAVARHGSTTAAAQALGADPMTVVRRIASLEARLGTRLLEAQCDGYRLTAAGLRAAPAAERIAHRMDQLAARLPRGEREGTPDCDT